MTLTEIIGDMTEHYEDYAIDAVEQIPVSVPRRRSKKRRIQKKLNKRFGFRTFYKEVKCKKIEVTLDTILDYCIKNSIPPKPVLAEIGLQFEVTDDE